MRGAEGAAAASDEIPAMDFQRHPWRKLAAIYAGGVAGALIRVGLAQAFPPAPGAWPWPTFAVNMAGALLLGYFFALFRDHPEESLHHPFLGTGICGTLTTFSTMQLELYRRWSTAATSASRAAYCAATLAGGYLCVRLGIGFERRRPALETPVTRARLDRGRPARRGRRRRPLRDRRRGLRPRRRPVPARDPRSSTSAAPSRSAWSPAPPCTARR